MTARVGVIGLGVMATRMITNARHHGGFTAAAAWDPDPAACERAAELFPDLRITDNAAEAIKGNDIDGVYIASPPIYHREYAEAAMAAGKPVLSEKPLGIDVAESRILTEQAAASATGDAVNFTFATAPAVTALEAAISNGTIGDVAAVDIRLHFCKWPRDWQVPAAWLSDREQGGFVRETFSHYAYLTEKLFGPADLIHAVARYPDDGRSAETHALAMMECGDIPVTFAGGTGGLDASGADRIDFTVWGSKAAYRLYDWNRLSSSTGDGWCDQLTEIDDTREEGYRRQVETIGSFFSGNAHVLPGFADALRVQELVEAILTA